MDGRRPPYGPKGGNAHRGAAAAAGTSKRNKGKGASGGGGGVNKKKPVKVVYIGNPMRVTTSAEGFRALVQKLTGRHADPSKYNDGSRGSAIDVVDDDDYDSSGLQAEEPQPGALPICSPGGSTEEGSSSGSGAAAAAALPAAQIPAAAQAPGFEDDVYYDDDEDRFMPQLIDNSYSVFSPPTFLYAHHNELM